MSDSEPRTGAAGPRILVGVDGSKDGLRAAIYAMRRAVASDSAVWLVHVVDGAATHSGLWELVSTPDQLNQGGQRTLDEAVDLLTREGFPADRISCELLAGPPGKMLAEISGGATLMVVGRRAIGGLERMFVGSTSLSVATRSACPVIVISAASTPQQTGGLHTVAVAVSSWPAHEAALEWGVREASGRKARLLVVHVVPQTLGVEGDAFVAAASAGLQGLLDPLRAEHPATTIEVQVLLGDTINDLVAVTKTVDLLIVGVHHDRAPLGGAIRSVIAQAHCPIGLIKERQQR